MQGQYITHVINSSVARLQPLAFTKLATYSETSAAKSNFDILLGGGRRPINPCCTTGYASVYITAMLLQLHWLLQVCIGDKTGLYNVARQVHPVIFSTSAGLMVGGLVVVVQTASAWLKLYTLTTPVANLLPGCQCTLKLQFPLLVLDRSSVLVIKSCSQ